MKEIVILQEERAQQREQQTQIPKVGMHLVPEEIVPSSRTTDKLWRMLFKIN